MTDDLKKLESMARSVKMTLQQQEAQRRSFAYGNAGFENDRITRAMVDEQADKLVATSSEKAEVLKASNG